MEKIHKTYNKNGLPTPEVVGTVLGLRDEPVQLEDHTAIQLVDIRQPSGQVVSTYIEVGLEE